jgi:hypothetical protein
MLPVVLYGLSKSSLTFRDEYKFQVTGHKNNLKGSLGCYLTRNFNVKYGTELV